MTTWILTSALPIILGAGTAVTAPEVPESVRTLDTMVVSGDQSGPAIWEFTRGSKKVWVLGTFQPLPEGTAFNPSGIEARVARSGVVLSPPGLVVGENIGILRGLTLWPSIRRTKFNPDDQSLQNVLPPATYAKWQGAKARLLGNDEDTDRLRPMYAAYELFEAAAKQSHLTTAGVAGPVIERSAKKHNVPWIDARFLLAIRDPKDAVKHFGVARADDIQCLEQTLERLGPFMQTAPVLGEAWASGDLARLSELANGGSGMNFCWARLTNQAIGSQQGVTDVNRQVDAKWLSELQAALSKHDTVFTTLPLRDLIGSTGLVAALKRDGFQMSISDAAGHATASH